MELSQKAVGLRLSPDDAYLIMRGLRTLDIRLDKTSRKYHQGS